MYLLHLIFGRGELMIKHCYLVSRIFGFGTFWKGWYGKYFTTDWPGSCIDGFEIIYWKRFHLLADTSASSGCQCDCFQFIRNSMKRTGHIEGKGWHIAWISWIFSLDLKNFRHFYCPIFFLCQCKCLWPDSSQNKKIDQKLFFLNS